jgi:tetratricopeptide (TPR) repeat protein
VRQALELKIKALGAEHADVGEIYEEMANVHLELEDEAAALRLYLHAHDIAARTHGLLALRTALLAQQAGRLHAKLGHFEDAEEFLTQTASALDCLHGDTDARAVDAWRTVAMLQLKQRAYDRAGILLARVLEREVALLGADSVRVADTRKLLGTVYLARQQLDEALAAFRAAHRVFRAELGDEHAKTRGMAKTIASVREHVADTDTLLLRRMGPRGRDGPAAVGSPGTAGVPPLRFASGHNELDDLSPIASARS